MWKIKHPGKILPADTSPPGLLLCFARRRRAHVSCITWRPKRCFSPKHQESVAETTNINAAIKDKVSVLGPQWVWTYAHQMAWPIRAYNRAQDKRPYVVQLCSSLVIYFLGDLASQVIEKSGHDKHGADASTAISNTQDVSSKENEDRLLGFKFDPERSIRTIIIGSIWSIPSLKWFLFLSHNFNVPASVPYSHAWSLAIKIVVAQVVFTPVFNSYFFGMQSLLSSTPKSGSDSDVSKLSASYIQWKLEAAWDRIRTTVPITWYNSCKFWPFVTAFSFTFIRPQNRSVFAGIVAVGWQGYLGIVNQKAANKAKREGMKTEDQ